MEFATAPLQSLIVDHTDSSQLKTYVDQLAQQFDFATDEKTRYGTLQVLFPMLKAYLNQLPTPQEKDECLSTILRPIVLSTLAHNALISTESLAAVIKAASQFALTSLVTGTTPTNDSDMCVGHGLLRTLLGQLILVMDIEPDFVDLSPLTFVDNLANEMDIPFYADIKADVTKLKQTCQRRYKSRISMLQDDDNDDDGSSDDGESIATDFSFNTMSTIGATKMTLSDFSQLGLLDLDACLDTLIQFIQDALDSQDQELDQADAWIELIMIVAIAMLPCTNMAVRAKLMNVLLPLVLEWQRRRHDDTTYANACQLLWKRVLQIFGLPATNLLRMETYGLIAKFFDLFFGLDESVLATGQPHIALDLRFNTDFFIILQSGLRSDDSLARKYTTFLLKRVLDFCQTYPSSIPEQPAWTVYFEWDNAMADDYDRVWDEWFLLYDVMHETEVHLVTPVLPRLEHLMSAQPSLHSSWWNLLIYRGFHGDCNSSQKAIWEYIFTRKQPDTLNRIGSQLDFFFNTLWKCLDSTALFAVSGLGLMVSAFGEHVKTFIARLVPSIKESNVRKNFLQQMIHHLAHVVTSHILIMYTLEGLAECDDCACWGTEELKSLRHLLDRHHRFETPSRKRFIRKLGLANFVRFTDPAALSFSDIAKTVSSLVSDLGMTVDDPAFKGIHTWLNTKASHAMPIADMENNLLERMNAYVNGDMGSDIPFTVLDNQALVLTRSALFFILDENTKAVDKNKLNRLLSTFSLKIQNDKIPLATFNRLLVLLSAFSNEACQCYKQGGGSALDITTLLSWPPATYQYLLKRIESEILSSEDDTATDDKLLQCLLSLMAGILKRNALALDSSRDELLKTYHERLSVLLALSNKEKNPNKELAKVTHLRTLAYVYKLAMELNVDCLPLVSPSLDFVANLPLKRVPDLVRLRIWGDSMSNFMRYKWECLEAMVRYTIQGYKDKEDKLPFDPSAVFSEALDQLESASDIGAEAIINCMGVLLSLPWEKDVEVINMAVTYASTVLNEYLQSSKVFPVLIRGIINMIIQPRLLCDPELNRKDGPVKKVIDTILDIGDWRPFIVHDMTVVLHEFWSSHSPQANASMLLYTKEIARLLTFGPLRDREDQKLDAAMYRKLASPETLAKTDGSAAMLLNQNDYVVRVMMNDLILRLDIDNEQHREIAIKIMNDLMEMNDKPEYYETVYINTAVYRFKVRSWMSILLLLRFVNSDQAADYINRILVFTHKETNISVRVYMEWIIMRLFLIFPEQLPILYRELEKADNKPSLAVSILTVCISLGAHLDQAVAGEYFDKIFVLLAPWLIPNHYTVRLYAFTAWEKNWQMCQERGYSHGLDSNPIVQGINRFAQVHPDYVKMKDRMQEQYYLAHFDPVKDFNLEFIFREFLHVFSIAHNERIGSRAFLRVNKEPIAQCPFSNPDRQSLYSSADPVEQLPGMQPSEEGKDILDESYQKKITPWEVMLETDIDLTKALVTEKKRRNEIIVVASLVDRIPNLAGLCRTCEIFNASELVVHSLKVKDDPYFASISVSSEKWMPMSEVRTDDLEGFLLEKKQEGYVLCGMEQTTNSVKLGEYEFPDKCVLLLGKEKEGVPAHLLRLLDQCIEIPQYGITRSLNVHVTGSICLYEYTKQIQWRQQQLTLAPPS
ncbi:hypothetical protein DM01DRAFT_1403192 [Hesseltinella vesiculosa]|uniref:tRNA (guanosine(18)-2'-O)-methyltransferase TARBP1 n=1 Tax=Hesseltinella vesiculosa TaxID=101127 RepID=A0A1X2GXC4_9FUNG|nr:hypothetical protein DM01DRAFT_1403192 [Hesseltinella vesiculosa]